MFVCGNGCLAFKDAFSLTLLSAVCGSMAPASHRPWAAPPRLMTAVLRRCAKLCACHLVDYPPCPHYRSGARRLRVATRHFSPTIPNCSAPTVPSLRWQCLQYADGAEGRSRCSHPCGLSIPAQICAKVLLVLRFVDKSYKAKQDAILTNAKLVHLPLQFAVCRIMHATSIKLLPFEREILMASETLVGNQVLHCTWAPAYHCTWAPAWALPATRFPRQIPTRTRTGTGVGNSDVACVLCCMHCAAVSNVACSVFHFCKTLYWGFTHCNSTLQQYARILDIAARKYRQWLSSWLWWE